MDPLTHSLVGAHLFRLQPFRTIPPWNRIATALLASNLPDLDGLLFFFDRGSLWGRAGPLHSAIGALALALLLAVFSSSLAPRHLRKRIGLLALSGVGLHLLFDALTIWRLPLLWPFSPMSLGLGWLHRIDLWLIVLLAAPLLADLSRGRRGGWTSGVRRPTVVALVSMYLAICGVSKGRAIKASLQSFEEEVGRPRELQAYPVPYRPFLWTSLARTDDQTWHRGVTSSITGKVSGKGTFTTGGTDPRMQVALGTSLGASFADQAEALYLVKASPIEEDGSFEVALGDLRFSNPRSDRIPWILWLRIGPDFTTEEWAFMAAPDGEL